MTAWAALAAGWIGLVVGAQAARRVTPIPGDLYAGLIMLLLRAWARLLHRLRVEGRAHIPRSRQPGPMLVIANHVSGADALLIQAACPFPIRWLMAEDMRWRAVEPILDWAGVIPVDRRRGTGAGLRPALRALRDGGVVGLFPEGEIGRQPDAVGRFLPGVGALIARTDARVLPVVVTRSPPAPDARSSLYRPSRSRIRFMPIIEADTLHAPNRDPDAIARDLHQRFSAWIAERSATSNNA